MKAFVLVSLPLALAAASPAWAQFDSYNDPAPGAASLIGSNYASAEREIMATNGANSDPAAEINLGIALAKQGQKARASELFNLVLAQDNVEMIVANGRTSMSHDLAHYALASLQGGELSR